MAEAKYFYVFQEEECGFEAYFTDEKALTSFVADYLRDFADFALGYKVYRIPIKETFNCKYADWKSSPSRRDEISCL